MNIKKYEDYYDFAECLECDCYEYDNISVIGDYEMISEVLKNYLAITESDYKIMDLELCAPAVNGYEGPYIFQIGDNGDIWCNQALNEKGDPMLYCADLVFVLPQYYKTAVEACDNDDAEFQAIVFSGQEEEEESKESPVKILSDAKDKPCGFEYNYEGDGYCCHMRYCSCDSMNISDVLEMYNKFLMSMAKWF